MANFLTSPEERDPEKLWIGDFIPIYGAGAYHGRNWKKLGFNIFSGDSKIAKRNLILAAYNAALVAGVLLYKCQGLEKLFN